MAKEDELVDVIIGGNYGNDPDEDYEEDDGDGDGDGDTDGDDDTDGDGDDGGSRIASLESQIRQMQEQRLQDQAVNASLHNRITISEESQAESSVDDNIKSLEEKKSALRTKLLEAYDSDDLDPAEIASINESMTELSIQIHDQKQQKQQKQQPAQQTAQQTAQQPAQQAYIPQEMRSWISKNEWYSENGDPIKIGIAQSISQAMVQSGLDINDSRFYDELDNRINAATGQRKQRKSEQRDQSDVSGNASGQGGSIHRSRRKQKFTEEDKTSMSFAGLDSSNAEHRKIYLQNKGSSM